MAATIQQRITKELADLRIRQVNEIPEIQVLDSEKTHARIIGLLDELERAADAAPGWNALLGGAA
jgi:molecular chaperone GrpE (heat shock protein)